MNKSKSKSKVSVSKSKVSVSKSKLSKSKSKVSVSKSKLSKSKSKKEFQRLKRRNTTQKTKKRKVSGSTSITFKSIEKISITKNTDIKKYEPVKNKFMVRPKVWELQNRKAFYQWLMENFDKYETGNPAKVVKVDKEERVSNPDRKIKQLLPIQKLVRDFMQTESPYRGLLLYFGLGVGKTISAIAVAEAILNKKKVVVLSKASLEGNFRGGIKTGGRDYMIQNNYWVFTSSDNEGSEDLRKKLDIPKKIVNENGGFYLINFSINKSNYNELSQLHRSQLDKQIDALIDNRFTFYHTDDKRGYLRKVSEEGLDNKVIIIDEVHNETNNMSKNKGRGDAFYNMFMNTKNSKFIFLTGTPIINRVYEASKLFNILRGYIQVIEFKILSSFGMTIDFAKIKSAIKNNRNIDQIMINKISKTVKITKTPDNYINSNDPENKGVIYVGDKKEQSLSIDELKEQLEKVLKAMGHKFSVKVYNETALPNDEKEFEKLFYNPELHKLKKPELFKKRIAGLTSFYDYKDPKRFPILKKQSVVSCPMNEYQLSIYEKFRHEEIQKDKRSVRRKKGDDDVTHSSYRIHSRLACSFVFPDDMPNKYNMKNIELMEQQQIKLKEEGIDIDEVDIENEKAVDKFIKEQLLQTIKRNKKKYLDISTGALDKYSPKYVRMINNIQKSEGLILLYSYFKTLIGLNIFALALEATGEWKQFKIKKINGLWHLITGNPEFETSSYKSEKDKKDKNKNEKDKKIKHYIFYSGSESKEEKVILPLIFNSEFDRLPATCAPLVKSLQTLYGKDENLHGDIIKCLMTTQSGAEGLDLKCVRSVHISEPYWQPVLIEQVIGRAVRTDSHMRLPPSERNVEVFIYMANIPSNMITKISFPDVRQDVGKYNEGLDKKGKVVTSDEALYILSEHKKVIVSQLLKLIKESSFDCSLNYSQNIKQSPGLVCLDYDSKNRDEYLFTPGIEDTMDIINIKQEYTVSENYTKIEIKGIVYYHNTLPTSDGKYYIYDETLMDRVRSPKPVGQIVIRKGKKVFGFYPKKKGSKKSLLKKSLLKKK